MAEASPGQRPRPLSPHLQIWRWHLTMLNSILHRITGSALYVGALVLMGFFLSLAGGPTTYDTYRQIMGSIIGKLVLFGLTLSVFFHLANGVRHLTWDMGEGFALKTANGTAMAALAFALVATILVWVAAGFMGAL